MKIDIEPIRYDLEVAAVQWLQDFIINVEHNPLTQNHFKDDMKTLDWKEDVLDKVAQQMTDYVSQDIERIVRDFWEQYKSSFRDRLSNEIFDADKVEDNV